jgi:hypothetical protein
MGAKQRPRGLVISSPSGRRHEALTDFQSPWIGGSHHPGTEANPASGHRARTGERGGHGLVTAWAVLTSLFSPPPAKPAKQF